MTVSQLTSRDNPLLKSIRLIVSGSPRAPEQLVVAEGVRVLEEVNSAGCEITAAVFSEHFGAEEREKKLLDLWLSKGIPSYVINERLFQTISGVQTPQGAIALVRMPKLSLHNSIPAHNALVLCACEVQDPGNLGTLIRTAAAAGASLVCTSKGTVSARNPKALRSSAGAFFRIPVVEHVEPGDFEAFCDRHSIQSYRTDARQGVPYMEADLRGPCAIVLGNEGNGITLDAFSASSALRIPMAEGIESLNVATAGAILLFEAFRQRTCAANISNGLGQ
jgi:RNA methyltransferase, TrmH family